MKLKNIASHTLDGLRIGLGSLALFQFSIGAALANAVESNALGPTRTPIKHVIVIIGENRSFDHVFATYVPQKGERVWNLLSEEIINSDGTPGPYFQKAEQRAALDPVTSTQENNLESQPEGRSRVTWFSPQSSCCHIW